MSRPDRPSGPDTALAAPPSVGPMDKPVVVVGTDGSTEASRAVRWAAEEAARRGAALRVVHAWVWPLMKVPLGPAPGAPPGAGLRAQADRVLADATRAAHEVSPALQVESSLVTGDAATRLVEESRAADLLVLGHRGLGGFAGLLLGSVGLALATHASCPVVVVRGRVGTAGHVVVGVDASPHSSATTGAAFAAARRLGTGVVAVHASARGHRRDVVTDADSDADADADAEVERDLAATRVDYPDVPVTVLLCEGSAPKALVSASRDAGLVVVGARGSGGGARFGVGSTTHALLHHADCPVLVVPGAAREPADAPPGGDLRG